MRAIPFFTTSVGTCPADAFETAVLAAQIEFEDATNTGTIAGKRAFEVLRDAPLAGPEAVAVANAQIDSGHAALKPDGPALCIPINDDKRAASDGLHTYLFFGLARAA